MSIRLMSAVFDRFPGPRSEMLLAIKLADFANDDGTGIYPSVRTLAEKTRADERTVQRQIAAMVTRGWLVFVCKRTAPYGTNEYRIDPVWVEQGWHRATSARAGKAVDKLGAGEGRGGNATAARGDTGVAAGVTPVPPNPSKRSVRRTRPKNQSGPEPVGATLLRLDLEPAGS